MYDPAKRKRSVRKVRERGCWIFVPGEELERAGFERDEPPPFYRVYPGRAKRRNVLVQFYREA